MKSRAWPERDINQQFVYMDLATFILSCPTFVVLHLPWPLLHLAFGLSPKHPILNFVQSNQLLQISQDKIFHKTRGIHASPFLTVTKRWFNLLKALGDSFKGPSGSDQRALVFSSVSLISWFLKFVYLAS